MACLVLAYKYYNETEDVASNRDLARILEGSLAAVPDQINAIEGRMLDILDFDLFVSQDEFNSTAATFNSKVKSGELQKLSDKGKPKTTGSKNYPRYRTVRADSLPTQMNQYDNLLQNSV